MRSRSTVAPPSSLPAQRIAPTPSTHIGDALVLLCVGSIGWGVLSVLEWPLLGWASLVVAVVAAAVRIWTGVLGARRRKVRDLLVEALAGVTGSRDLDRRTVKLTRWTRGWPGVPRGVVIRYAPGAADGDPAWKTTMLDILRRRLQVGYRVVRHDQERCQVVLERDLTIENPTSSRVERTIKELIGPTTRIRNIYLGDDGEPRRVEVAHEASTRLAASGYRARVERTFSMVQQGRWRARWDLVNDQVVFELRPSFPSTIWLPPSEIDQTHDILASYAEVAIPYGVDEDGNELVWRPAIDPNLMVVGAPGTGKTVFEHGILAGASRYGWPIWVVDGKAIEFLGWRTWPNVQIVATTIEQQVAAIHRAWELMEHRYALIVAGRATEDDFEPLLLFLDEFADFRANLMAWYASVKIKGEPTKPIVLEKVASIARKGRSSRVHLLFATQRPDAEYFGGDMRDNFRARISMGRLSPQGAMMMWQDPTIGTTVPRGCRGRATTINDDNQPVEIQTFRVPDPRKVRPDDVQQTEILDSLRPTQTRHDRLLIMPPDFDPEAGESEYRATAGTNWVLADAHPELDPVHSTPVSAEEARELSSPMAMFNLGGAASWKPDRHLQLVRTRETSRDADAESDDPAVDQPAGFDDGYGPKVDLDPEELTVGDLIDLGDGQWATVDIEPDVDLLDTECMSIGWRDDADNEGVLNVPFGTRVDARRPLFE